MQNGEGLNTQFDKWLGNQLKDTQVEPPKNFNQIIFEKLSENRPKGQYDPTILFILVVVVVISTIFMTLSSLSSDFLISLSHNFSAIKIELDISKTTQIVLGVTIIGLIFFAFDHLLFKKVARKNLSFG